MTLSQVHVSLLASGEAPEDLIELLILDHLMQHNKSPWVQYLIDSCPIIFVLDSNSVFINLILR